MSSSAQKLSVHQFRNNTSPVRSLPSLKEKHISLMKKLKFTRKARPKMTFADIETKSASSLKEKLLFLHSENKRYNEKAFFADIDNKKCDVMSEFYSDHKDMLNDITQKKAILETKEELEKYLITVEEDLTKDLTAAQETFQHHQKSVAEKDTEVKRLTAEMVKAKDKSLEDVTKLKKSLEKGTILTDTEILRLSMRKCQETNTKLSSAVEIYGKHLDELREKYLWKRDGFVEYLAKEQINSPECKPLEAEESGEPVEERSNPSTPRGSMYDLLFEKDSLVGAVAKISQNTKDLTKYFYKLADLKSRLEEANNRVKGHSTFSAMNSTAVIISNLITVPADRKHKPLM